MQFSCLTLCAQTQRAETHEFMNYLRFVVFSVCFLLGESDI